MDKITLSDNPHDYSLPLTLLPSLLYSPQYNPLASEAANPYSPRTPFVVWSSWSGYRGIRFGGYGDHTIEGVFVMEKRCSECKQVKTAGEFYTHSTNPDGLQYWCRQCMRQHDTDRRNNQRTDEQKRVRNRRMGNQVLVRWGLKKCSRCELVKLLEEFSTGGSAGGKRSECIECHRKLYPYHKYVGPNTQTHEQWRATAAVASTIERGDIIRPTECSVCHDVPITRRRSRIVFHHTDGYDKEHQYTGVFVCAKCHTAIHREGMQVEGKKWL